MAPSVHRSANRISRVCGALNERSARGYCTGEQCISSSSANTSVQNHRLATYISRQHIIATVSEHLQTFVPARLKHAPLKQTERRIMLLLVRLLRMCHIAQPAQWRTCALQVLTALAAAQSLGFRHWDLRLKNIMEHTGVVRAHHVTHRRLSMHMNI